MWSSDRIGFFLSNYQKRIETLKDILSTTSFGFPHLVDADWRLDYLLRSDTISKINQPQYFIKLKIKDQQGSLRDTEFTCTIEQLQDMVNKLQDASHSVDRLELS